MSFWRGETLRARLPDLIAPFRAENIDCASYTLTIGHEVYVSPTDATQDPKSITKCRLANGEGFTIPPGQFAFLLSEEIVTVPAEALGLISMKARIKFRGLVNVSGFHVDPGFRGRLIFSVFNAGPTTIHLQQGQQCFLIWYASLDQTSAKVKDAPVQEEIGVDLINNISGELQSFEGLAAKIKAAEKTLGDRINAVEREHAYLRWGAFLAFGLFIAVIVRSCPDSGARQQLSAPDRTGAPLSFAPGTSPPATLPTPGIAPTQLLSPAPATGSLVPSARPTPSSSP